MSWEGGVWVGPMTALAVLDGRDPSWEATDFVALQQDAQRDGINLPPSTLRAMLTRQLAIASASGASSSGGAGTAAGADGHAGAAAEPGAPSTASDAAVDRMDLCEALGGTAAPDGERSLAHLPDCVLLSVLALLDAPALARIAVVSREFAALVAANDDLWCALVARRYEPVRWALPAASLTPASEGETWRAVYARLSLPGEGHWRCLAAAPHATQQSCWIVIDGAIYDVTTFMHRHPGMAASLQLFGGTDATAAFEEVPHSEFAHRYMRTLTVPGLELPAEDFPPRFAAADASPGAGWRFDQLREIAAGLRASTPTMSARLNLLNEVVPPQLRTLRELMPARVGVGAISEVGRAAALRVGGATSAAKEYLSAFRDPLNDLRATLSERISGERTRSCSPTTASRSDGASSGSEM